MTSIERREIRYQRRKAKRESKKMRFQKTLEEIFTYENLATAARKVMRGCGWKTSVMNFRSQRLQQIETLRESILNGTYRSSDFSSFTTIERGKLRYINAPTITDRMVQKCLCAELLIPLLSNSFICDNGACLPGKGYHYQLERLKKHLCDHIKRHGVTGGIYQFDFKGYFSSIPHARLKERLRDKIQDDRAYDLVCLLIDDFQNLKQETAYEDEPRGIGLGSEISQVLGLEYASPIDHYVKDICGIKGYGRYNDDGYVISDDMEELEQIRTAIESMAQEMGITISSKKSRITPLANHGFTFLKVRFYVHRDGSISMKPSRKATRRCRRMMKTFRNWIDRDNKDSKDNENNKDSNFRFADAMASYQSWRSYIRSVMSHRTLYEMDADFIRMFWTELRDYPKRFICTHRATFTSDGWKYAGVM